jgi:hypothetical protein
VHARAVAATLIDAATAGTSDSSHPHI